MAMREDALECLARLGLPEVFRRLYTGGPVAPRVAAHFRCPEAVFYHPDANGSSLKGRMVPLFVDPESGQRVFFDPEAGEFVEAKDGASFVLAPHFRSWQQYLAERLIRIAEAGAGEEELKAVAEATGFKYVQEVLAFRDACLDHPAEEYQDRRRTCLVWLPD
jgi:hypothetical protein